MAELCEIPQGRFEGFTQEEIEYRKKWFKDNADLLDIQFSGLGIGNPRIDIGADAREKIIDRKFAIISKHPGNITGFGSGDLIYIGGKKMIVTVKHTVLDPKRNQETRVFDLIGNEYPIQKIIPHPTHDIAFIMIPQIPNIDGYDISKTYSYKENNVYIGLGLKGILHVNGSPKSLTGTQKILDLVTRNFSKDGLKGLETIPNNVKAGDSGAMIVDEDGSPKGILVKGESITESIGYIIPLSIIYQSYLELEAKKCFQ